MEQRTAQLEQQLHRLVALLQRVPLRRWQWLAIFLLVIWLSYSLARLFWLVMPNPAIPPASVMLVGANSAAGAVSADAVDIAQLKALSPFGNSNAQEAAPTIEAQPGTQGIEQDAADTQLNLVLRGVLGSTDDKAGRAIIVAGDRADVYAVGDTLPVGNNVTLAKVLNVRVIINNNGTFESLWLFKEDPNAPQITVSAPAAGTNPRTNRRGYAGPPYQQQASIVDRSQADAPRFGPDHPDTEGVAKSLADVVGMSIYRENGAVIGYKIRPGRNVELFNSLGLQNGDIVTAVNGVPLSNPGKVMEIYKSMGSATSANLEIRRGGSTVNLDVMLK